MSALLLPLLWGSSTVSAQDFNPANPPEPQAKYKLTVKASPAEVGYASGAGRYEEGKRVYLNTSSSDSDYAFKRWERNGETISTSRSFYYTTRAMDDVVTAIYEFVKFDPVSPDEPEMAYKQYRLYLACDPQEACSFNINSGERYKAGEMFNLRAYPSQSFVFDGWFDSDGNKVADDLNMSFTMPGENTTLTARFTFMPDSPDEPQSGNQDNVDNKPSMRGDVNDDKIVNVTDATIIIAHYLAEQPNNKKYDINEDGVINITDASIILTIYLTEQ